MNSVFASSVAVTAECVALRLLPFALYAALRARAPWAQRTLAFASIAPLMLAPCALHAQVLAIPAVVGIGIALAYIAASAFAVHALGRLHVAGHITRPALALAMVVMYLLVPSVLLSARARIDCLTLGWEAALAGYSFGIDGARSRASWRDCLFFMTVNPLLVYAPPVRVRDARPPLVIAGRRIALGILVTWVAVLAMQMPAAFDALATWPANNLYAGLLVQGAFVFVVRYAALSGVASMQWGAMRWIGYEVPERYRHPFLATSPLDFFRRWNLYVGAWFGRYVFQPLSRRLASRGLILRRHAVPVALAATMLSVGAFHDLFVYATDLRGSLRGTLAFGFAALAMVAWAGLTPRRGPSCLALGSGTGWRVAAARVVVFHMVCAFCALLVR